MAWPYIAYTSISQPKCRIYGAHLLFKGTGKDLIFVYTNPKFDIMKWLFSVWGQPMA